MHSDSFPARSLASLLAVALAAEARARGRRTLLIDLDPRGDAHAWSRSAQDQGLDRDLTPTTLHLPSVAGGSIGAEDRLRGLALGYDLTVIDTPNDPELLAIVAGVAELTLIPCRPSPMDAWATVDTVETCVCGRTLDNFRMQIAVVPNAVDPRTTIGGALANDLRALGLPVLRCAINRRVAHQEAMAHGSTASLDAPSSAAAREIGELLDTIEALRLPHDEAAFVRH